MINKEALYHSFQIALYAACYVLLTAATAVQAQSGQLTLREQAEDAKRQGRTSVIPDQIRSYDPEVVNSVAYALGTTVPMLVQIDGKVSQLESNGTVIATWYLAHLINDLNRPFLPDLLTLCDYPLKVPPGLGSLVPDSLYIQTIGGKVDIDGVTVTTRDYPASLHVVSTYLLFLRFEKNRSGQLTRATTIGLGEAGVFNYSLSTDSINPLVSRVKHSPFVEELMRHGKRLGRLQSILTREAVSGDSSVAGSAWNR